jgi:diguanylate cyclase (GGDEF)-like protein
VSNTEDWKGQDGKVNKEWLFQRRVAELRSRHDLLPWHGTDVPQLEIPSEESALFTDRETEGPEISDAELASRALLDLASQTFNFKSFFKRLNYELKRSRRYKRDLSLLLVGIDGWPKLLEEYGTESGDAIISQSAKVLLSAVRDVDIPGRCREDAFGVILPETPPLGAEVAAERIRTHLEDVLVTFTWKAFPITVSIGISSYPKCGEEPDLLFGSAAEVLLQVMAEGGNRIAVTS